jgi:3-deoxy-manno-octulosonate cytidylyltransferase (CMP-KDO synthetase)
MIIIPARLKSTRLQNKVLVDIGGLPMVIRTIKAVEALDFVAVATDSQEVYDVVKGYGYECVMTQDIHTSGTDRVNEAATLLGLDDDEIVVNVQADEPFIEAGVVEKVMHRMQEAVHNQERHIMMASCYKEIDVTDQNDPNMVKVVLDHESNAIYFSRSGIPYNREETPLFHYGHLGVYAFSKKSLQQFCQLPHAPLEDIEKLEQLRAVYYGHKVAMVKVEAKGFGIDTIEDLEKARELINASSD